MTVELGLTPEERVREQLRWDTPLFAANCCHIVPKQGGRPILIVPKPEQLRFDEALRAQEDRGQPARVIILKSRQIGFSTWTQIKLVQRVTQRAFFSALVLAQLNRTAQSLFNIGQRIWQNLPDEADLRPRKTSSRKNLLLELDNGSSYQSDSAKEFEAGRGLTLHGVHASEVAFFPDAQRKLTGLLEAVPDEPGTIVVLESTANGHNHFKDLWDSAVAGNDYLPFFSPWFHELSYRWAFANDQELEAFIPTVGDGSVGEDEPMLLELLAGEGILGDDALAALNWRRRRIRSFNGDIDKFHQEYPSTPEEAFLTTGRSVFSIAFVRKAREAAQDAPQPQQGFLRATATQTHRRRGSPVEIPLGATFEPGSVHDDRKPGWWIWEHPQPAEGEKPPAAYILAADASGGETIEEASAYHTIEVVRHDTREQVAEYRSRVDPDLLAFEIYLACLYFNRPWAAVEVTGGWGGPAARRLYHDYNYPLTYVRPSLGRVRERAVDRLGWDTNHVTKGHLVANFTEMLREDTHGIRSLRLAQEVSWYTKDDRNRMRPEKGRHADLLVAYMIAQEVAREKPLRTRRRGETSSTLPDARLNPTTGYPHLR